MTKTKKTIPSGTVHDMPPDVRKTILSDPDGNYFQLMSPWKE